jgi:hypothetical protein
VVEAAAMAATETAGKLNQQENARQQKCSGQFFVYLC